MLRSSRRGFTTLFLAVVTGAVIAVGACSPEAQQETAAPVEEVSRAVEKTVGDPNQVLRDEVATLFTKLEREQGLSGLREKIAGKIKGGQIRGIDSYEYPILNFGMPAFDLKQLRAGRLPYYVPGDFDCDGKQDHALLLSAPKSMLAVSFGTGRTLGFPKYDGDAIEKGSPGRHPTAAGKGHGSPKPEDPTHFDAPCDFITVHWWQRSSYAVLYDPSSGKFRRVWMGD